MTTEGFDKHPEHINRKGAPKKEWTWANLFRELSDEMGDNKKKVKIAMAKAMIQKAKEGDVQAFKEIANRTDGLPKASMDMNIKQSINAKDRAMLKEAVTLLKNERTNQKDSKELL